MSVSPAEESRISLLKIARNENFGSTPVITQLLRDRKPRFDPGYYARLLIADLDLHVVEIHSVSATHSRRREETDAGVRCDVSADVIASRLRVAR